MRALSRRFFIKSGSAAVIAAGAISSIPGLPAAVGVLDTQGPADADAAEGAVAGSESAVMSEPLVAHVRDLSTGEIGLVLRHPGDHRARPPTRRPPDPSHQ